MKRKRKDRKARVQTEGSWSAGNGESSWLPGWAPYVVFGLLTIYVFREFIISKDMLFGTDVAALGYYARHWYAEMVRGAHTFPLWNPYIFGGLPFVDAMHGDIFYPTTVLKFMMPVHRAMGWKIVLHVFLAGVFTYHWLRHLKVSRPIATFGGVAYMLAPVLVSLVYPGHDGKLFVTALTPLALWVTDWAITRGGAWRFATLAAVVALLILTAHMQLAYFVTWAIVVLAVFRLVQAHRSGEPKATVLGRFGALALAGIVGAVAIGAVQIWTPLRYLTKYSQRVEKTTDAEEERGYAYSTSWSLHPEEAFSLVVPEFVGANIQTREGTVNTYWGRNAFKLNLEYAGFIPLLLLPLAFLSRRRRGEAWLFAGMAGVSLIYALGATTPLFWLFYLLVPGVKLFRAPSSIMFIFAIAVITAAALGLESLREREEGEDWAGTSRVVSRYLWSAFGVLLVLALLGWAGAFTEIWTSTIYRGIEAAKAAALQSNLANIQRGLWLSALFAGALATVWQLRIRGSVPQAAWLGLIIILGIVDPLRATGQFVQVLNPSLIYPRDDTTEYLLRQQSRRAEPFRVFLLGSARYGTNHFAFFGLEQLTGHHGNEMGRYQDLVSPERIGAPGLRVLRLLNVRYLVSGAQLQTPALREAYRGRQSIVYEFEESYPRAFLVSHLDIVTDSEALLRLMDLGYDTGRRAFEDYDPARHSGPGSMPPPELTSSPSGRVTWVERGVNRYTLEVEASEPAVLVVSENFYPAWRATIDGMPATVVRADYTLRALEVPAGTHTVRFEYRSSMFRAAVWTSLLSTLLVASLIAVSLFKRRREGVVEQVESGAE
jgi:hypothetical protein